MPYVPTAAVAARRSASRPGPAARGSGCARSALPGLTLQRRGHRPPDAAGAAARAVRARAGRLLAELVGADARSWRTTSTARPSTCPASATPRRRTTATTRSPATPAPSSATSTPADAAPCTSSGNSLGGAVATRVAAVRPDLVRTLTLVSPALPEMPPQRTAVPTALLAVPGVAGLFGRLTRDWTAGAAHRRRARRSATATPAGSRPRGSRAAVEEYERRLGLPYFWDAMARSARGIVDAYTLGGQHALWRQAERVLAPTLLVYGGRDQLVVFRMARRAARAFRDSRLLTLPDAGHVAMMEYPEIVAGAFRELLDETDRSCGRLRRPGIRPRDAPVTRKVTSGTSQPKRQGRYREGRGHAPGTGGEARATGPQRLPTAGGVPGAPRRTGGAAASVADGVPGRRTDGGASGPRGGRRRGEHRLARRHRRTGRPPTVARGGSPAQGHAARRPGAVAPPAVRERRHRGAAPGGAAGAAARLRAPVPVRHAAAPRAAQEYLDAFEDDAVRRGCAVRGPGAGLVRGHRDPVGLGAGRSGPRPRPRGRVRPGMPGSRRTASRRRVAARMTARITGRDAPPRAAAHWSAPAPVRRTGWSGIRLAARTG